MSITNNAQNIPAELKACQQWILWRYERAANGRMTKVPYSPAGHKTGSQTAEWSFDALIQYVESGDFSGIGFSFKESDRYIGIDYDSEKDAEDNIIKPVLNDNKEIIDPAIAEEVAAINSYTEISPSGNGIHIICKGDKLPDWKVGTNKPIGELYFSGRFFTVTGDKYKGSPDAVNEIDPDVLKQIYYRLNPESATPKKNPFQLARETSWISTEEIKQKLMNDPKARDLFMGNSSGYKSHSEADEALCCKIAFFTKNPAEIDQIFRSSGLYREDKWDKRKGYAERTIEMALSLVSEQYSKNYISPSFAKEIQIGEEFFQSLAGSNAPDEIKDIPKVSTPQNLLTVPGILGKVVDYYEATAPKSQPQFAVQTALALGSVVLGRRWKTDWNNYSSLYFINVGLSSAGKEHAGSIITELLTLADRAERIGTSKYSSGSAVYSELRDFPTHIGIIDEFGKLLEGTKKANNAYGADALSVMMQMWGRCGGIAKIPALSTLGATQKQKEAMQENRTISHPALSIIAMTTPSTFYNAITMENITSGFIPRFIIVESEVGRQKTRKRGNVEIDPEVLHWIYRCTRAHSGEGNMADFEDAELPPDPVIVPISAGAEKLFSEFEDRSIKQENALDMYNIAEVLGRTNEIAMRVSLIVAVSCNSFEVLEEHARWAIEYVNYYAQQTVDKIKSRVSNSDFEAICKQVIEHIRQGKNMGSTVQELSRKCPLYGKSDDRVRAGVIKVICDDYDLVSVSASLKGKGGRSAERYILHDFFNESEWAI